MARFELFNFYKHDNCLDLILRVEGVKEYPNHFELEVQYYTKRFSFNLGEIVKIKKSDMHFWKKVELDQGAIQ